MKCIVVFISICYISTIAAQNTGNHQKALSVGVATIDITPSFPILLSGYEVRNFEATEVLQRIHAKAIAFGEVNSELSVLIAVELVGIQGHMTEQIAEILSRETGLDRKQFVICADHVHSGPEIGNLINQFGTPLSPEQIGHIDLYLEELTNKLVQVAKLAISNRAPSFLSWGQGKANFAMNRRMVVNGKNTGFGANPEGLVDNSLPMLKVTDLKGNLKAILLSYACHNTTLGADFNKVHGDWAGEAQRIIQERHPGVTAMVILGCGADADPYPRLKLEYTTKHGKEVADEVDRLLKETFTPVSTVPKGKIKIVQLPFYHVPTVSEFIEKTRVPGHEGYYALLSLNKIARGEKILDSLDYPIMTWNFGNDLTMIFLGGEVVADYALRLRKEIGKKIWINAYSNDIRCYIPSKRVIQEGGYEVDLSMYEYNQPSRFSDEIEEIIIKTVNDLLQK